LNESAGNRTVDTIFILITGLLFTLGLLFGLGFGGAIFSPLIFILNALWVASLIAFLVSRANFSRAENLTTMDTLEEIDQLLLEPTRETSFVIPSHCPYCREPVILEEIEWLQSDAFSCRFCGKSIPVKLKHER